MSWSRFFKPKMFILMLGTCAVIAWLASLATGLDFWILLIITIAAVLTNGVIAAIKDRNSRPNDK